MADGLVLLTEPKAVSASNRLLLSSSRASEPVVIEAAADCAAKRLPEPARIASRSLLMSVHRTLACSAS
jgi:hypothetical protein